MREIREGQTATKTRYAKSAFGLSQTRLINAIDHAEATTKLARDLGHPIAIWTTARATLEQCATIWWLLTPDIDYRRRAARVMRIRSADADNMEKFAEQIEREFHLISTQVNRTRSEINKERKKMLSLVEAKGRRGAAEVLGVSYGALAKATSTGRLTGRMRDALTRRLLEGGNVVVDDGERDILAELERRVSAPEEDAEGIPEGEETQGDELRQALARIGEEQERQSRRIADLETYGPTPPVVPAPHAAATEE